MPTLETTDSIRFVLDGKVVTLRDVEPTRTVLEYLREDLGRTGTKEGCAEGDCGACTVVVLDAVRNEEHGSTSLGVRAVNACIQFLPTLHGKELLTVESLSPGPGLHRVQQAMVDHHGSQCGFCTPGFIMSLFALFKTVPNPDRDAINMALAGNLCRCTGYRPIVDAALAMYVDDGADADHASADWIAAPCGKPGAHDGAEQRLQALLALDDEETISCGPAPRRFYAPTNLDSLDQLMQAHPQAQLLAGGTDVGLWVTKRLRELGPVIYLGRVRALTELSVTDTHVEIGAAATLSAAMPVLVEHYPGLRELLQRFASPPIRNAATLGGNIANGSPIGDSMPALIALGAQVVLRGNAVERELALEDFYLGYQRTAREPGEVLTQIRIPRLDEDLQFSAYKVSKRFEQDISAVCAAFAVRIEAGRVAQVRTGFGGVAAIPARAIACEAALQGKPWNEASVAAAGQALIRDFTPIDDMRAHATYRQRVSANLLRRFFLETQAGALETQAGQVAVRLGAVQPT